MGKSSKTGNQAVSGITSTSTTKATTSVPKTTISNSGSSSGSSSSSKSTTTKSSGSGSSSKSSGSSSSSQAYTGPSYANQVYTAYANSSPVNNNLIDLNKQAQATRQIVAQAKANVPQSDVQKIQQVDITELKKELQELADSQTRQAVDQINNAVQTGTTELNRAYEDALPQYQAQRNQIAADEARALDNQVLYASKRGDMGGIGQSQYGSIQNTAATNQQTVNAAQIKLYTDTSRQIADLEAKGEFEKADKILEISQEYTSKLMELQKWAKDKNIDIDEFNAKVDEWKAEYDLSVSKYLTDTELNAAKVTGAFSNGTPTMDTLNDMSDRLVESGKAMMNAGIVPSNDQLAAMGWTPEQYWIYKMANYVS
ncbi:MAG: hypothetical protein Q4F31_10065 [Eubacteriales bacterium]|nr:hypothetical protein [Eubacteriales bacterium]